MKACIVTVYNSENCGSYWQAYALKTYLESRGFQVYFLKRDTRGSSHSPKKVFLNVMGSIRRRQYKRAAGQIKQYWAFKKAISLFETVDECDESFDVCILGSDTIWNLDNKYFVDEQKTYWGQKSRANKTISYAASIANTQEKNIDSYPKVIDYLEKLDAISVRDYHSFDILSKYTKRKMEVVCDPTLLFDKDFYYNYCRSNSRSNYIFVYYFENMPSDLEKKIRKVAQELNLEIVVMGNSMIGDEQIYDFSPLEFIDCFCHAKYVITNTFHGTLFSIILEKNALFNSDGKEKIKDILKRVGLAYRDYSYGADPANTFKLDDIDYSAVKYNVMKFRKESIDFLDNAVIAQLNGSNGYYR